MSKKIITRFFNYATQAGASHLVISGQADHLALDCHFPDESCQTLRLPKKLEHDFMNALRQMLAIAPGELITKKYYKLKDAHCHLNFHLTILPDGNGEKIIISLLNQSERLWSLNQLGLESADLKELKKSLRAKAGLIIISAPERGGKSATLRALLAEINDPRLNIYLLGKTPPTVIAGVNSLPLNEPNWDKILQHDSDIIAVDDLDDEWTRSLALRSARSGRLLLGTLSAANGQEALRKITPLTAALKLKAGQPKIIINQRLVKLRRQPPAAAKNQRQIIGRFEIIKIS